VSLETVAVATQIAAAVSSIALARRRGEHLPAAVALVVLAVIAVGHAGLFHLSPTPVIAYVDGAGEIGSIATISGLCLAVAMRARRRWRALAAAVALWALACVGLGLHGAPAALALHRFYFAADLFGLFISAAALVLWAQRDAEERRSPCSASAVALALTALDGAILLAPFSPWRGDVFGDDFAGPQTIIILFFAVFTAVQVIAWKFSLPRQGPTS
jgi:hypothetical protein